MAQLDNAFDSNQHDDMMGAFDPIPAGKYKMIISNSDIKENSKKNGQYIKLEFTILDGDFKGRKIWTNLNISNPNPVAVEIAQKELATICRACNKVQISDTQQLHDTPMLVKVKITPAKGDYPASNSPCGYESLTAKKNPDFVKNEQSPPQSNQKTNEVPWE